MDSEGFKDLVRRAQAGDRASMDRVLEVLRPQLERLARPFADPVRPAASTSDLLQETCLRAWQKLDTFEGGQGDEETFAKFRAWIGRIVRNLGMNLHREQLADKRSPGEKILSLDRGHKSDSHASGARIDAADAAPGPGTRLQGEEMARELRRALKTWDDRVDAEIVRMHFFEELTFPEISEQVGLRYDQVRERYRSTMRDLEKHLKRWK